MDPHARDRYRISLLLERAVLEAALRPQAPELFRKIDLAANALTHLEGELKDSATYGAMYNAATRLRNAGLILSVGLYGKSRKLCLTRNISTLWSKRVRAQYPIEVRGKSLTPEDWRRITESLSALSSRAIGR